jgi:hypothetical protein
MAAVIAECMSASVEATTRATNVDAFMVWSACRIRQMSKARAASSSGSDPDSMYRKLAACGSLGFDGIGSSPERRRWNVVIRVGNRATSRRAFRSLASADWSQPSGS